MRVTHTTAPTRQKSDLERLCGYLKNDSVIRWKLGCSQAEIDRMRARIAARKGAGWAYLPPAHTHANPEVEERQRRQRAVDADRQFKRAIMSIARGQAHG